MKRGKKLVLLLKCPVSTAPGQMLIQRTPCFLYWAWNFPIATFIAALLIAYPGALSNSNWMIGSRSAIPVDKAITFLALPARISGMNWLIRWILETTLIWKDLSTSSSKACGSSPLGALACNVSFANFDGGICAWDGFKMDLQHSDRVICIVFWYIRSISHEIVKTAAGNLGSLFNGTLFTWR